jgi:transcriptional regulator with XRE-family HTH domain
MSIQNGGIIVRMDEEMEQDAAAYNAAVGAQIRAEAAKKRISLVQLAKLSGVGEASVNRYVAGNRAIPIPALYAIAAVLGVPPDVILDRAAEDLDTLPRYMLAAHHNPDRRREAEGREESI